MFSVGYSVIECVVGMKAVVGASALVTADCRCSEIAEVLLNLGGWSCRRANVFLH